MSVTLKGLSVPGVVALIAVACGGATATPEAPGATNATAPTAAPLPAATDAPGATPAAAQPTAAAAQPTPAAEQPTPGAEQPGGGTTGGASYARLTINGQTYDFAPEAGNIIERCDTNFFGGFWVLFQSGFQMTLPGETWEAQGITDPASVQVTLPDETEWTADPETYGVQPGQSQVDSYSIDGAMASGTATFVDTTNFGGDLTPVSGTFEAACAADFGQ